MSLIEKMKCHCQAGVGEWREYTNLLAANSADEQSLGKLAELMPKLNKLAGDVEKDKAIIERVKEIRGLIGAAKNASPKIAGAFKLVTEHGAQTKRILSERETQLNNLASEAATLQKTRDTGEAAVKELSELKVKYPELLQDAQGATMKDLD